MRKFESHGDGQFARTEFNSLGDSVIFESGVRVWHPETITIGNNVYIGHDAFLKSYPSGQLTIGNDTWIGQQVFIHSAGGVEIGVGVGIGPRVSIFTSFHQEKGRTRPILDSELEFKKVTIQNDADIGIGAILLPGVTVGKGAQIGAGAVVTTDVEPYAIVVGNPAKLLRYRP